MPRSTASATTRSATRSLGPPVRRATAPALLIAARRQAIAARTVRCESPVAAAPLIAPSAVPRCRLFAILMLGADSVDLDRAERARPVRVLPIRAVGAEL